MAAQRKYWWEEWFSRPRTVLVRGIDYICSQSTMVQTLRNNASTRGISIRLHDVGEAIVLEVIQSPSTNHPGGTQCGEIQDTDPAPIVG